jgi:hypothetical protein
MGVWELQGTGVSLAACVNFGYDHAEVVAGHLSSKRCR